MKVLQVKIYAGHGIDATTGIVNINFETGQEVASLPYSIHEWVADAHAYKGLSHAAKVAAHLENSSTVCRVSERFIEWQGTWQELVEHTNSY